MFPCPFSIRVNAAPKHAHPAKSLASNAPVSTPCAPLIAIKEKLAFSNSPKCKKARTLPNQIGVLAKSNLKRSRYLALEVQLSANKSQKHAM